MRPMAYGVGVAGKSRDRRIDPTPDFRSPLPCHIVSRLTRTAETNAMAKDLDPLKLSSPRIFLVRMTVFLILCALVVVVLYRQILVAFMANPSLNALIIGVLLI